MGGCGSPGPPRWDNGARGGFICWGVWHEYMIEALVAGLDMPADQIEQRIASGDTFGVILQKLGLANDVINNLIVEA